MRDAGAGRGGARRGPGACACARRRRRAMDPPPRRRCPCGAVVLAGGVRLTPQALGLAASVGAASCTGLRRPRVALLSTGDELVMPGEPLPPGAIYNSNRFILRALLQALGCECSDMGIVPDRLEATRAALREAAAGHDLILTIGGVRSARKTTEAGGAGRRPARAVADRDQAGQAAGLRRGAARAVAREAQFIGLPGNPVSSFVTFLLCVAPVLRALQGMRPGAARGVACGRFRLAARRQAPRVPARAPQCEGGLELFANQSSGVLTSAVWADGLVDNPPGNDPRGDTVRFLPMAELIADEGPGALLRLAARGLGAQEALECQPAARSARCAMRSIARSPRHAEALARGRAVRVRWPSACATRRRALVDGAEVAFFPPVTGAERGGARVRAPCRLRPVGEVAALRAAMPASGGGGFVGTVRDRNDGAGISTHGAGALPRHDRSRHRADDRCRAPALRHPRGAGGAPHRRAAAADQIVLVAVARRIVARPSRPANS